MTDITGAIRLAMEREGIFTVAELARTLSKEAGITVPQNTVYGWIARGMPPRRRAHRAALEAFLRRALPPSPEAPADIGLINTARRAADAVAVLLPLLQMLVTDPDWRIREQFRKELGDDGCAAFQELVRALANEPLLAIVRGENPSLSPQKEEGK